MPYRSTKTYGHDIGLSCCFRQPGAGSHCRFLHGYALSFHFVFEAKELDENNWVIDFGSLKPLRRELETRFDHKLVICEDDPHYDTLMELHRLDLADVRVVQAVGCEAFAKEAFEVADMFLLLADQEDRVRVVSVEVREHGANSAIYMGDA